MKFSEQWLREWVNPSVDTATLSHQLTMAGLEVDAVEPAAPAFSNVVVGRILKAERHPDADKLQVCSVDVGDGEPRQIICGAANAREGLIVAAALVGAVLPDLKIKKAKLRGVESFGMLCSAKELGLAESADGILELAEDAVLGTSIRDYFQLDDNSIEIGLTPNRSDCLSLAGIAREVGVINRQVVSGPDMAAVSATIEDCLPVKLEASGDCPRYLGRIIKGIRRDIETPLWMAERLRRSGVRSIDPVVDVTNYVMLELGQPMHAFDLSKLNGGIVVRHARAGERLKLLNGQEIELTAGSLVIADEAVPVALAGIMGGDESAVGETSRDIFLESAFFSPTALAGRARSYGLHTDSSHRFERGVDPQLQRTAIERATALLLEIVGGEPGPIVEEAVDEKLPQRQAVTLRPGRIERILGKSLEAAEVSDILTRLGMEVVEQGQNLSWQVTPPSYRFDIAIEVDLIEELARIYGYDNLPSHPPIGSLSMAPRPEAHSPLSRLRQVLLGRDYQEVITYSFVDPELQRSLQPDEEGIMLANPISSEMSAMRTSLLSGLLGTVRHNLNRQQNRVRIFESGLKFQRLGNDIIQEAVLGGAICGTRADEQWGVDTSKVDFYDIKGDVEALTGQSAGEVEFHPSSHPALHPGQSAEVLLDGESIGFVGALHPAVQQSLDIDPTVYVFELSLTAVSQARIPAYQPLSRFPAIRRDLAIVVEQSVSRKQVEESIREDASEILQDLILFDVYVGKGIDSGRKSLALGLTLQDNSRTLTDEEVEGFIAKVVSGLETRLGATLRV